MSQPSCCDVCQKTASQRCGGCHQIFYCTKAHQKAGWKRHKSTCRPFKVVENDVLGRHLVSTKPIKIGDKILKERPLIHGPSQETIPVCLGCGKGINDENNHPCLECGWPMCSEICRKNPSHLPECRYTVQRGEKVSIHNFGITHPIYHCITVLRCLYQKQFLREIWNKLDTLQSHCEERKHTPRYKNETFQVAEFIRRFFKLKEIFRQEEIMRICGIVLVNSHEVPLTDPPYIAIYEICSMFEHNCRANCSKSFTNDGSILISAGEDIPTGEHLSICYCDALWGTPNRRHYLYDTKFFTCTCARCCDVTEFGTNFSAMKCREKDCNGYLLPKTFLDKTDNTKKSDWNCNKCDKSESCFAVQDLLERLGSDLAEVAKNDVIALKKYINSSSIYLHPNHYYLTEANLSLVQLMGQDCDKGALLGTSDEDLDLKARIASQLLKLASVIAPAEKRLRGILFFELHAAVAEMGRRSGANNGEQDVMQMRLIEAKQYLIDCIEFLKNEPSILPEGLLVRQARENLKSIEIVLERIHQCNNNPT